MSAVQRLTSSFGPEALKAAPKKSIWTTTVIVSTVMMLCTGTMNTIGFAIQSDKYGFKHGVVQTALMFLGEFINLFLLNSRLVGVALKYVLSLGLIQELQTPELQLAQGAREGEQAQVRSFQTALRPPFFAGLGRIEPLDSIAVAHPCLHVGCFWIRSITR